MAFPLDGRAAAACGAGRVEWVRVDLATPAPIPVYRSYYEMHLRIARHYPPTAERLAEIRRLEACAGRPPAEPASVRGEFRGRWVRTDQRLPI